MALTFDLFFFRLFTHSIFRCHFGWYLIILPLSLLLFIRIIEICLQVQMKYDETSVERKSDAKIVTKTEKEGEQAKETETMTSMTAMKSEEKKNRSH